MRVRSSSEYRETLRIGRTNLGTSNSAGTLSVDEAMHSGWAELATRGVTGHEFYHGIPEEF